jgi:protein-L-isoaspartate(D-aspartate) O-methyltransferase
MRNVPRHVFIPEASVAEAYENRGIPILDLGGEPVSSLSAPGWVAFMLEELTLEPGMRVLEVGAGTGYHAALLACLVGDEGRVVTIEIEPWLAERASTGLTALGFEQVDVVTGDGALGAADEAPFDRILLTTGTWELFPAWTRQLVQGGKLVAPVRWARSEPQSCVVLNLRRDGEELVGRPVMSAEVVAMRGDVGGARAIQEERAGEAWTPSALQEIRRVRVYPRSANVEPRINEKLFVRGECQILFERESE